MCSCFLRLTAKLNNVYTRVDRRTRLRQAKLYLCTDARREHGDLAEFADAVLSCGVDIIQLRDKGSVGEKQFGRLEPVEELAALEILAQQTARHHALLAVNDRADIALAASADVLHLGQKDIPVSLARRIVGPDMLIGRSTHTADHIDAVCQEDIDYFCVGPCWSTPTKPNRPATGLDILTKAHQQSRSIPWFAIGGITIHNLPQVLEAGAERIVVVRAITNSGDPGQAVRQLRDSLMI